LTDSPNVELVRTIYADWERGDFFSRADWADPDIEFVWAEGPDLAREPATGVQAMARSWRDSLGAAEDFRTSIEELREIDEDRVLVLSRRSGLGRTSGLDLGQLAQRTAILFHIRDGRVTRILIYVDRERAFADLDLTPGGES
jgi:ketosteroid isomerase-like protein